MSSSKYIPQVGDTVRLINSGDNWCDESATTSTMTEIQENTPLVIVTKVSKDDTNEKEDHYAIRFDGDNGWQWTTRNGHFELYEEKFAKDKSHNEPLIKLLKEIQ